MDDNRDPQAVALRQITALNRIARIAVQDLAWRPMLQRIVDTLAAEFGWEFVACATVDHERQEFVCDAVCGLDSQVKVGYRRALGTGVVGRCALTGETIDIDQFKSYNDSRGHLAGDDCLREVARVLSFMLEGGSAHLARYGGEEFAVLLPDAGPADAEALAERLRRAVEARALEHPASTAGRVTISVGVAAIVPPPSAAAAVLVAPADAALYRAKRAGRNRVESARG